MILDLEVAKNGWSADLFWFSHLCDIPDGWFPELCLQPLSIKWSEAVRGWTFLISKGVDWLKTKHSIVDKAELTCLLSDYFWKQDDRFIRITQRALTQTRKGQLCGINAWINDGSRLWLHADLTSRAARVAWGSSQGDEKLQKRLGGLLALHACACVFMRLQFFFLSAAALNSLPKALEIVESPLWT